MQIVDNSEWLQCEFCGVELDALSLLNSGVDISNLCCPVCRMKTDNGGSNENIHI